jgi:hypothetical protein
MIALKVIPVEYMIIYAIFFFNCDCSLISFLALSSGSFIYFVQYVIPFWQYS